MYSMVFGFIGLRLGLYGMEECRNGGWRMEDQIGFGFCGVFGILVLS
jgi:hypothetical protein